MTFPRPVIIETPRGSDINADIQFLDEDGDPFNLVGWAVGLYDVSPEIASFASVIITNGVEGRVRVRIEWDESFEVGVGYQFRVLLQDPPEDQATPSIGVLYQ